VIALALCIGVRDQDGPVLAGETKSILIIVPPDLRKMKVSELTQFAEEQTKIERKGTIAD
jgi:hypothetical protein